MTFYILCRDMHDWQIAESLHKTLEGAKRRAQEIVNGEYMEFIDHDMNNAIITPAVQWMKAKNEGLPDGLLWGKAEERGFSAEFILREFEMGD